jgi:hypothetical protein
LALRFFLLSFLFAVSLPLPLFIDVSSQFRGSLAGAIEVLEACHLLQYWSRVLGSQHYSNPVVWRKFYGMANPVGWKSRH